MKITIVGSGNSGCAHAALFSKAGHSVRLLKTSHSMHDSNFNKMVQDGGIVLNDLRGDESFVPFELITRDPAAALKDTDAVFVMVQSGRHEAVAELVAESAGKIRFLCVVPGYMGSLYFYRRLKDRVDIFAEGESSPYDARLLEDGKVKILFKNVRNALAFLPSRKQDEGLSFAGQIVDTYRWKRANIIESAMHNPNLIVHTVGAIMSAARIEYSGGNFWMYKEGFTPSIWRIVEALDEEKMNILEAVGLSRLPYLDACKFRNEDDLSVDSLEVFRSYANSGGPKGPETVESRFIYEDVPVGLRLLNSLGKTLGVATPVCDSLITLGGALLNRDYWKEGRTVEALGLTRDEILRFDSIF